MRPINEKSVLVIDDEHTARVAMEQCLTAEGFDVLVAGSAHAALDILAEAEVDCIVSDWHLGDTQGIEVLQKVRYGATAKAPALPFIIITGVYTQPEDLEHAFRLGATDYVEKPIVVNKISLVNRLKKAVIEYDRLMETEEQIRKEENFRVSKINGYEQVLHNFKQHIETMIATTPLHKHKLSGLLYDYETELARLNHRDTVRHEVNQIFPGFLAKLEAAYPRLAEDDLLICCCLLLKEGNQTIANRLNMSDESFRKRKTRLKDKLDIEKGCEFYPFLRGVYNS